MPSPIDPKNTKWKYFYRDENNNIQSTFDKDHPAIKNLNKTALLTTSLFYSGTDKNTTPEQMKNIVKGALLDSEANFCIALPYEENYGASYYDENKITADCEEYRDIVMHDDFFPNEKQNFGIGHMSAKKGAEQIASAIENGFDILQMGGGVYADQKIALVRDYFRENPLPENHQKTIFAGFSDGSSFNLSLPELTNFVLVWGAGKLFPSEVGKKSPIRSDEMVKKLIKVLSAKQDVEVERELNSEDGEAIKIVRQKYEEAKRNGNQISHITYFPRQLVINIDSPYRVQFAENEKLIIGLEGYLPGEPGHRVSEALYRALECGAINPEQILCLVIEDLVSDELFIRRINGKMPRYEDLTEGTNGTKGEKEIILDILKNNNSGLEINDSNKEALIRGYIERADRAYENEVQRIKMVAELFDIPVIFGGKTRGGHAVTDIVQLKSVQSLEFTNNEIKETAVFRADERVQNLNPEFDITQIRPTDWSNARNIFDGVDEEESVFCIGKTNKEVLGNWKYTKESAPENSTEASQKISEMKFSNHRNKAAEDFVFTSNHQAMVGVAANLYEMPIVNQEQNGLMCVIPPRQAGNLHFFDLLLNAGKLGKSTITPHAPGVTFVIFSVDNPDVNAPRILKFIEEFGIKTPIFFTTKQLENKDLPSFFSANIDLKRMMKPEPLLVPNSSLDLGHQDKKQQMIGQ